MKVLFTALLFTIAFTTASAQSGCDSLAYYRHRADSLHHKLFVANYKLERVKYYITITKKNPNNKKFFFGWITRAVK